MIKTWQYKLFPIEKGEFNPEDFENIISNGILEFIQDGFITANEKIAKMDFEYFDKTTIANVVNNIVTGVIFDLFDNSNGITKLKIDRRRSILLDEKYLLIFKKTPVSNNETGFSKEVKNQSVPNHILTIAYTLDEFYSTIRSANIEYRIADNIIYGWPIALNSYTTFQTNIEVEGNEINVTRPEVRLKIEKKKQAQE